MRAAGMETSEDEPAEILRRMIQEREHDEVVAKLREDQSQHDAIMRANWRARPWHQKLRYWVLGAFLLIGVLEWATGGSLSRTLGEGCRDISYVTGRCM